MNEHYETCMCVEQKQYFEVNITVPSLMCTDIFVLLFATVLIGANAPISTQHLHYTPQHQTHPVSDWTAYMHDKIL